MDIFIDFDNTMYDTPKLTKDMLQSLSKYISETCNQNYQETLKKVSDKFGKGENRINDIYDLIDFLSQKEYNFEKQEAIKTVNNVIFDGEKYLFQDTIPFLEKLQKKGNKVYILSYHESRVYFQTIKIAGSGLLKYVNGTMTTTSLKGEMPFDFSKSVFIDDNPRDLASIYKSNPYKIFRIRRENSTYSNLETNLPIPEFSNLNELIENFD